jgi:flagellar biosynthetic protein FliO
MPPVARIVSVLLLALPTVLNAQTALPPRSNHPMDAPNVDVSREYHRASPADYHAAARREARSGSVVAASYPPQDFASAQEDPPVEAPSEKQRDTAPLLSRPSYDKTLPRLTRPSDPGDTRRNNAGGMPSALTVASGLAIVLGLFLVVAWLMRRASPAGFGRLPGEVVEVLGRTPLGNQQQLQLVRCGSKLVLLSVTSSGAESLTEITDSDEVARLTGLCRQSQPGSASHAFRQVFQQFADRREAEGQNG